MCWPECARLPSIAIATPNYHHHGQAKPIGGARTESVKQPKPSSQTTAVNAQAHAHAKENTNFHIIILNCILNYVLPEPSSNSSLETKNTTSSNYRNNLPCPPHHCCCHLNKRPTWSPNERASERMDDGL